MKINKQILFGIFNLIIGGLTFLYFWFELLMNLDPPERLSGALYCWPFEAAVILSILSGVMLISGKRLVWAIVGIAAIAASWTWHIIALWRTFN
jgi:hypothetical protein